MQLSASDKQHLFDLYSSKGRNCCYEFDWPCFGMAYGNPRFRERGRVLTKVVLERSRMVLCSADRGAHGRNGYWRAPLEKTLRNLMDRGWPESCHSELASPCFVIP